MDDVAPLYVMEIRLIMSRRSGDGSFSVYVSNVVFPAMSLIVTVVVAMPLCCF